MPELSDRFASLSRTRSPDLWPEIEDREPGRSVEPSSGRRLVVALAAFVIAIAGIGLAGVTFGGSRPGVVSGTAETANGPIYFRVGGADGHNLGVRRAPPRRDDRVRRDRRGAPVAPLAWIEQALTSRSNVTV